LYFFLTDYFCYSLKKMVLAFSRSRLSQGNDPGFLDDGSIRLLTAVVCPVSHSGVRASQASDDATRVGESRGKKRLTHNREPWRRANGPAPTARQIAIAYLKYEAAP